MQVNVEMASLMHSLTGRKRESDVWQYFTFLINKRKRISSLWCTTNALSLLTVGHADLK